MFTLFNNIWAWLKGLVNSMIGTNNVQKALGLAEIIPLSSEMTEALTLWSAMYKNQSPWTMVDTDIKSLNLAPAIASEISALITLEMKVDITGSKRAEYLAQQFAPMLEIMHTAVEYGSAKGGIILKPYVKDGGLAVTFFHADQFYPVAFDGNGKIESCVFVDHKRDGQYHYKRLEYHRKLNVKRTDGTNYEVINKAYKSNSADDLGVEIPLESIADWAQIQPYVTMKDIKAPLFGYFKYPLANNIDSNSPLGVSCFSRAVGQIEQADRQWTRLLLEFETGERALYVDPSAFEVDEATGKRKLPIKKLYRTLRSNQTTTDLFEDYTPTLRQVEILAGLDAMLKKVEYDCGLAYGTISDPNTVDKTATEIKSSKQRTYATVTSGQKSLTYAINGLLYAMDAIATLYKLAPKGKYETTIKYDDSIITDKEVQRANDAQDLGLRVLSRVEYRVRNYGESVEVATQKIAEIDTENKTDSLFDDAPTE